MTANLRPIRPKRTAYLRTSDQRATALAGVGGRQTDGGGKRGEKGKREKKGGKEKERKEKEGKEGKKKEGPLCPVGYQTTAP